MDGVQGPARRLAARAIRSGPLVAALTLCLAAAGESAAQTLTALTRDVVVERPRPITVGRFDVDLREGTGLDGLSSPDVRDVRWIDGRLVAVTANGLEAWTGTRWQPAPDLRLPALPPLPVPAETVRGHARSRDGREAIAARDGLFLSERGTWQRLLPAAGTRSWAPIDVRGVDFDDRGCLWFVSPQGLGMLEGTAWQLWTAEDGLPTHEPTALAAAPGGRVWIGTRYGAIRFDGRIWEVRQGRRWLPHDEVRAVAVEARTGRAFFATPGGVGRLVPTAITLAEKARRFDEAIERLHRRTPYGYVESVRLDAPGDTSRVHQEDSDNDGLWTSMYGASQAFAWAATKDPASRARAVKAFQALEFLRLVTQGGSHAPPPGFVARTVRPATDPDPNLRDSAARNAEMQRRDARWKPLVPRWPKSADGQWFWKADTSSDELDGHFFFYAIYHDLVATDGAERAAVRAQVAAITDHLLAHEYALVDHDGTPTRWAVFGPRALNEDPVWQEERGLNSTSILAYLRVAEHITGDARYGRAARDLIDRHGYALNTLIAKSFAGVGSGNQSDDEMAFMMLWCLLRYEQDEGLRRVFGLAFAQRWLVERREHNPLFHLLYATSVAGLVWSTPFGEMPLDPPAGWLEEVVDALRRFPLDRVNWRHDNSHRADVVSLPAPVASAGRGMRRDGRALPLDERFVDKWNHDPWRLVSGGDGSRLADGTAFLLPYYMARWAGIVVD